jgi:hypothetical protein
MFGVVSVFYKQAVIDELILRDPTLGIKRPRSTRRSSAGPGCSRSRWPGSSAAKAAGPHVYAMVTLLGECGLRAQEACSLRIEHMQRVGGEDHIRFIGKGNKAAVMPLPPSVGAGRPDAIGGRTFGPVVLNTEGNAYTPNSLWRLTKRLAVAADIDPAQVSPHTLRRTVARTAIQLNVPLTPPSSPRRCSGTPRPSDDAAVRRAGDRHGQHREPPGRRVLPRGWITSVIERQCRTSFVYRDYTDTLNGSDAGIDGTLMLPRQWVRALTAVTIDGTALGSQDLAACFPTLAGAVGRNRHSFEGYGGDAVSGVAAWPRGSQNIVIAYTAGFSELPPDDLKEVAMQAARWRVVNVDGKTGVGSRVLSETNDFGTVRMSVASTNYPTGIPDVDSVINGWAELTRVPATG